MHHQESLLYNSLKLWGCKKNINDAQKKYFHVFDITFSDDTWLSMYF